MKRERGFRFDGREHKGKSTEQTASQAAKPSIKAQHHQAQGFGSHLMHLRGQGVGGESPRLAIQ